MRLRVRTLLGEVRLDAGDLMVPPDPVIVTYPLFRSALLAINAIWQQPWACTLAFRPAYVKVPNDNLPIEQGYTLERAPMIPSEPTFPESMFDIPWFAYLSAPLAAGLKLPPEIQTERTVDGGLLMTATEERLDPEIPDHVQRARILAEPMIARARPASVM
jgi:hypothetical protein